MGEPLLRGVGLGHRFGERPWLFRDLDLDIRQGESLAILGPNGRGKSTLLQILMGSRAPTAGRIERSARVAYVPQAFAPAFAFRAIDLVLTGRSRHVGFLSQPTRRDEAVALASLEALGIAWAAERAFSTLSGGERQLVLLARALAVEAEVLLLDEPTAALDLRHQQQVLTKMGHLLRDGRSIVFTTHDPTQALQAADHSLLLFREDDHTQGDSRLVLNEETLTRLYGARVIAAYDHDDRTRVQAFVASDRSGRGP